MSNKVRFVCATLLGISLLWLFYPSKKISHSERAGRAAFTRPDRVSPASSRISIRINEADAIRGAPRVSCGTPIEIELSTSQMPQVQLQQFVLIVPRLPSQVSDGFLWQDVQIDLALPLSQQTLVKRDSPLHRIQAELNVAPGEYVVRYYLQSFEQADGALPKAEYIGQGRLVVEDSASSNNSPKSIPLANKEALIPLLREEP